MKKKEPSEVIGGLKLAAQIVLGMVTAGAFLGGFAWIRSPEQVRPDSFAGQHSPVILGLLLVSLSTAVLILTVDKWVKALPGIFSYATLGALIAAASGHLSNFRTVHISRSFALVCALLLASASAVSLTFGYRDLTLVDRVALLALPFCVAWASTNNSDSSAFSGLGAALGCLLFAWAVDRIHRFGRRSRSSGTSGAGPA